MNQTPNLDRNSAPSTPDVASTSGKRVGVLVGVGVSVALLVVFAVGLDWQAFSAELQRVRIFPLFLVIILTAISYFVRSLRWRHLLPSGEKYSIIKLTEASALGILALWVLPLRAGEFIRPWVLARIQPVSFSAAFASVVIERVFDVLALLVIFTICVMRIDNVPPIAITGAKALGLVAAVIVVVMLAAYVRGSALSSLWRKIVGGTIGRRYPALAETLIGMADEFILGLRAISSFRELLLAVWWSAVLWICFGAMYEVGLWAFDEGGDFQTGFLVMVMVALAIAAPSAPGFIGTFQLGCVVALSVVSGFSEEFAIAYSLVLHTVQAIFGILVGLWVLKRLGWGWQELRVGSEAKASKTTIS